MQHHASIIALIEILINDQDCIIIPNFGGFVVNVEDFIVEENPLVIYPRKKWIAFNERLNSDDGILSTQWALQNKISNKEAFLEINQFGKYIKAELAKNQKIKFGNIGEFNLSPEFNIVFSPFKENNYDLTMFGLTPVTISTLQDKPKPVLIEPIFQQNLHEEMSKEDVFKEEGEFKQLLPKHFIYTILAFIFAGFSTFYLTDPNSNLVNGSFSPFSNKFSKPTKENKKLKESINEQKNIIIKNISIKTTIDTNKINQISKNSSNKIHLIAGSFFTREKAEKALEEFKINGFKDANILDKNENETYYRISLGVESSFESGYKMASRLKKENKLDIWVYKPTSL
jgi:nucleoid DNA-binding protein